MTPADEAKRLSILLEMGVPVAREAIRWAEAQIATAESPSNELLELSTAPASQPATVLSHLHVLAAGADFWRAFGAAMPRLREYLVDHPSASERVAAAFYRIAVAAGDVPEEFTFAYRFEDSFQLARVGISGRTEDVHQDFMDELRQFPQRS